MLKVIEVVFDGKTFVPTVPVDLPTGTKASVELPEGAVRGVSAGPLPPPLTDEQKADWERLSQIWAVTQLPWGTVDEAVAAMRSPSWPLPLEDAH